jgi:hypothetical protein
VGAGFHLVRVAGIDVRVDWSLLIIFVLIFNSLAVGIFPAWHPEWTPALTWLTALGAALAFFGSVLVHEGDRFFHRDFFAFSKEVSSGIWLRPAAALGKTNALFHQAGLYRRTT